MCRTRTKAERTRNWRYSTRAALKGCGDASARRRTSGGGMGRLQKRKTACASITIAIDKCRTGGARQSLTGSDPMPTTAAAPTDRPVPPASITAVDDRSIVHLHAR
uniref:Uncharacterized protein n=1 Tax=Plectus sambesii TaxID=2011161 RepID=A0A914UZW2_9BILA